ncbi:hypothetical protein MRB53_039290 [Persea americana]|nr:hypothetical protein MRB53_039290 [Persea americana]
MFIKQIIIQGFKSYKDQTVIEPFSPKHNVIVGRNGSGKSNFFAAIRFVLSDAYTQMGKEERQALLHEGSGAAVQSAYVEVIFDNSDGRLPNGKDELILRRTIGQKKDEYSLDRKNATKSDVMNLLESAGFSRSNPYYIVPQGRVTALTNMKDAERLALLKEVAGTQVYEARRAESIRIMGETDSKRAKIDDLLVYINERLGELEEEKEELKEYQEKDRERRCLEYTIYRREQEELTRRKRAKSGAIPEAYEEKQQIQTQLRDVTQRLQLLDVDKKDFTSERKDYAKRKAQAELMLHNLTSGRTAAQNDRKKHQADLQQLETAIKDSQAQLKRLGPRYDKAVTEEAEVKRKLDDAEGHRQRLYAKEGRNNKFKSKGERDAFLTTEVDEMNVALATRKAINMQNDEEIVSLSKDIKSLEQAVGDARDQIENRGDTAQKLFDEVRQAKEARDGLMDQRKTLWREEAKLDSVLTNTQQEMEKAERFLSHMMDQNTSRGIAAVQRIKQQRKLDGVYGTLAELFEVSDKYKTAVEVTAGQSLFHVVVDTDDTATEVLEILQKEKAGRVTFMPLNRLKPKTANIPKSSDALEMISKLTFDPKHEKAMRHVFGSTIICPSLQIAAQYARSNGVNAITPDGDRSDKRGALTGGYHDPRNSRLDGIHALAKHRDEYNGHRARGEQIKRELDKLDQEITRAVSTLQKIEQQRTQTESNFEPLQRELRAKQAELQTKRDALEGKRRAKQSVDSAIRELNDQQQSFQIEMASDFKKNLSQEEEKKLEDLANTIPALSKHYTDLRRSRSEIEAEKSAIEVELRENLEPRLQQIMNQQFEVAEQGGDAQIKEHQEQLDSLTKAHDNIGEKLDEVEQAIEAGNTELADLAKADGVKQSELDELAKAIDRSQRRTEKSMAKRALLVEKVTEANKSIRDLGVLPEEAFTKYTKVESVEYSHVNKKAFEQYSNFTKQRESLTQRRTELDTSQASIRELIDVLDTRKDEAIERTFKQVSREFANVFSQLVPAGKGRLIIQRKADRRGPADNDDEEDELPANSTENYTGVGIAVSFNSVHDEQQRIAQLSGGQKSLCALALVFAIQQCDPAPFYLFDEIDANLDAQYRTAVAALLQKIAGGGEEGGGGQFICTTFRPEMVMVAEKCYGVAYSNKTSSIDAVDREDALKFVEGQVGEHGKVPTTLDSHTICSRPTTPRSMISIKLAVCPSRGVGRYLKPNGVDVKPRSTAALAQPRSYAMYT